MSEEYEKLTKRIIGIETDINVIRNKIDTQGSLLSSLRGLVNRKIEGRSKYDEEEESEKDIKENDLTFSTRKKFGLI